MITRVQPMKACRSFSRAKPPLESSSVVQGSGFVCERIAIRGFVPQIAGVKNQQSWQGYTTTQTSYAWEKD
jgi:hypothetical protein